AKEHTMSRLPVPTEVPAAATALFEQVRRAAGKVPNAYATIGTHSPAMLATVLGVDAALAKGALSRQEIEAIRLAVSEDTGCEYCVAAHSLIGGKAGLAVDAMHQIRDGADTGEAKRDALLRFVRTVNSTRGTVPPAVLQAVLDAGYTPQQVIEALMAVSMIGF